MKNFVPSVPLDSYEAYLADRTNIEPYYNTSQESQAYRDRSIAENEAFKQSFANGELTVEQVSNYVGHKAFFDNMVATDKVCR